MTLTEAQVLAVARILYDHINSVNEMNARMNVRMGEVLTEPTSLGDLPEAASRIREQFLELAKKDGANPIYLEQMKAIFDASLGVYLQMQQRIDAELKEKSNEAD